jgi:hypothetical protein
MLGQSSLPAILFKCRRRLAPQKWPGPLAGEKHRLEAWSAKPIQAPRLVNRRGFGAGHFDYQPPRFNQLHSFDQVSLTDLTSLQSGDSGQDFAAFGHVVVNQFL